MVLLCRLGKTIAYIMISISLVLVWVTKLFEELENKLSTDNAITSSAEVFEIIQKKYTTFPSHITLPTNE